MTGAGAPGAAGILHCLSQDPHLNVITADANPNAVGRYLSNEFITIPRADDPGFIDALLSICRQKNIHVLMPLVTRELLPLSLNDQAFALSGCKILVSRSSSLEIANDKGRLYEFLQWRGIETPAFKIVETYDQYREALKELGYPGKDLCFKPTVSNGSRGFRVLKPAINEKDLLFNYKPANSYISDVDADRILASGNFPQLLISEYLPGSEYSVDCLADDGETILAVPRRRTKMVQGISVEGEFVNDNDVIGYCSRIIFELKLTGNIGIQVKESYSGKKLILEINPRVQGTISAALGAGINFPVLAIKKALGIAILPEELQVRWGTKFSRYWREVFY